MTISKSPERRIFQSGNPKTVISEHIYGMEIALDALGNVLTSMNGSELQISHSHTICGILEMFRHSIVLKDNCYKTLGSKLMPLLVATIGMSLPMNPRIGLDSDGSNSIGTANEKVVAVIDKATSIICCLAVDRSARSSITNYTGLVRSLIQIIDFGLSETSRFNCVWTLANLACVKEDAKKMAILPGLVDSLLGIANPKPVFVSEMVGRAQEHAVRALMNLSAETVNQTFMGSNPSVIEVLGEVLVNPNPNTRGYAIATLGNLTSCPASIHCMIKSDDGALLHKLVVALQDDILCLQVLETLNLFSFNGNSSIEIGKTKGLLEALGVLSSEGGTKKIQMLAASILEKQSLSRDYRMPSHSTLLGVIFKVIRNKRTSREVQGIMAMSLLQQCIILDNRIPLAKCSGIFETLEMLSSHEDNNVTCIVISILDTFFMISECREAMNCQACVETLAGLMENESAREDTLGLVGRFALSVTMSNSMSKNKRLMRVLFRLLDYSCDGSERNTIKDTIVLLRASSQSEMASGLMS